MTPSSPIPSTSAHTPSQYYPWFDWLRAACACAVMLYHDQALSWKHSGSFAVQVFFALSGWLIGGMLLKTSRTDLTRFYFNRAIRIWIPYYIGVALLLFVSVLREPITEKWLEIVAYKLTFVYNLFGTRQLAEFVALMPQKGTLSHVWSVNAEEQFYLLAPILLVLMGKYMGRALFTWVLIAALAWMFNTYAAIVFGVLAAIVVDRYGAIHLTRVGRLITGTVLVASILGMLFDANYYTLAPCAALAIVLLLAVPGAQHRYGALVGGMSYPLYLNHWIGAFAFNFLMSHTSMRDSFLRHALSAVANVVLAMAMYWWIERRLLAKRNDWFTPQRGQNITFVAYAMVVVGIAYGFWMWR